MLFTSALFLFFFLPVLLIVYLLGKGVFVRNTILMIGSLLFYAWGEISNCWVMLTVMTINYLGAIALERIEKPAYRKLALAAIIFLDLSFLAWFKYSGFLVTNGNLLLKSLSLPLWHASNVVLPLGISFFVFHSLSYCIDIYRGVAKAQRNPINMALYISLFPQLVAGPIVRYHEIKDQLEERSHTMEKAAEGIRRFVIGLAKKMLIANAFAVPTDKIFALPASDLSMVLAWFGAVCYTIQIYFDFSGYSDMAVGLGLLFGFRLPENFNYPYIASSMRDFWQRWHMSLSNWFRDYLYIPLGGNRCPSWRVCLNLVIVFFLCGLWHGASWQFVCWGLYHGFFLGLERSFLGGVLDKTWKPLRHCYAVLCVVFSWVLFRSADFEQAATFYRAMFGAGVKTSTQAIELFLTPEVGFLLLVALLASMPTIRVVERMAASANAPMRPWRYQLSNAWVLCLLLLSIGEVAAGTYNPFIYFRF
jgi:alginate O-acetyltransferase complex protein AlgI